MTFGMAFFCTLAIIMMIKNYFSYGIAVIAMLNFIGEGPGMAPKITHLSRKS